MHIIRQLDQLPASATGGALAIGNFDGVHHGHARLLRRLVQRAREVAGPAVVFTFDPHPARLLRPELAPPPLTWIERKAELLAELHVEYLVAYPTDLELLALSADQFFERIVVGSLRAKAMVEGPNFFFGRDRAGDIQRLAELCAAADMLLEIVEPVVEPIADTDSLVSSSRIRKLVAAGELATVAEHLTQPYRIRGLVTHGAKRGRLLGFPTANLAAIDTLLPAEGVYAGRAFHNGASLAAAIHVGANTTFGETQSQVEVHIIDFADDLYGQPLAVDFLAKIRDSETFSDVALLIEQLHEDVAAARQLAERFNQ